MKSIWKYPLDVKTHQLLYMPRQAKIIAVGEQNEAPVLWAEVDVDADLVPHIFTTLTTGERYDTIAATYVGTVVLKGWYVAHIYQGAVPIEGRKTVDIAELQAELLQEKSDVREGSSE